MEIKVGDLVETCSLMPGVVMKITGDDIEVRMLQYDNYKDDNYSHCSLNHCGIVKITAKQAFDRLSLGKENVAKIYGDKENNEDWEKYDKMLADAVERGTTLGPTRKLHRDGSTVILMDRLGRIWITKRKKFKHDGRRKKRTKVTFIPLKQIL